MVHLALYSIVDYWKADIRSWITTKWSQTDWGPIVEDWFLCSLHATSHVKGTPQVFDKRVLAVNFSHIGRHTKVQLLALVRPSNTNNAGKSEMFIVLWLPSSLWYATPSTSVIVKASDTLMNITKNLCRLVNFPDESYDISFIYHMSVLMEAYHISSLLWSKFFAWQDSQK